MSCSAATTRGATTARPPGTRPKSPIASQGLRRLSPVFFASQSSQPFMQPSRRTLPMRSSRRQFLLAASAALATPAWSAFAAPSPKIAPPADQVLKLMLAGNQRFASGTATHPRRTPADFKPLAAGQSPIACVVACADSRVTPEILFDLGIGELFVVRVAGNYVDGAGPSVKGSVEYSVAELGVSLIMILGHSQCGAIKAAIQHLHDNDALPGAINDLVAAIKPAVIESEHLPGDAL